MSKTFKVTKSYVDHLGQTRLIYCSVDEKNVQQYCDNAKLEGYTIVSIEEKK